LIAALTPEAPGQTAKTPQDAKPRVQAVLFVCALNAVRSPMAEALARHYFGKSIYVQSAGVRKDDLDPFAVAVLDEMGVDASRHRPRTLDELEEYEGLNFDLIVTLSPEAHHAALELTRTLAVEVEYWPTPDATATHGSRAHRLQAYRDVRDHLQKRIIARFRDQV